MVSRNYLVEQPARPGRLRRAFNQQVVPAAIDAAGAVESVAEHVAAPIRRWPWSALGVAALPGCLLARRR